MPATLILIVNNMYHLANKKHRLYTLYAEFKREGMI